MESTHLWYVKENLSTIGLLTVHLTTSCTRVLAMWCYHVSEFYSKHTCGPIYVVLQMTAAGTTDDSKYSCIILQK